MSKQLYLNVYNFDIVLIIVQSIAHSIVMARGPGFDGSGWSANYDVETVHLIMELKFVDQVQMRNLLVVGSGQSGGRSRPMSVNDPKFVEYIIDICINLIYLYV